MKLQARLLDTLQRWKIINDTILLFLIFFLVIVPFGIVFKLIHWKNSKFKEHTKSSFHHDPIRVDHPFFKKMW